MSRTPTAAPSMMLSVRPTTKCVNGCLKGGSDPVLVSDGKVMKFDADSKEKALAHAGEMVKIDGSMEGDSVKINSIEAAK